ncbi:MAG: transposase [Planctomycetes bacterium]|nr:transposase [Planctomycetota bacterium]
MQCSSGCDTSAVAGRERRCETAEYGWIRHDHSRTLQAVDAVVVFYEFGPHPEGKGDAATGLMKRCFQRFVFEVLSKPSVGSKNTLFSSVEFAHNQVLTEPLEFHPKKRIDVENSAGRLSSDAGLLVVREFDQRIGLTEEFAAALNDGRRDPDHSSLSMVRQRIYGIIAGYLDQNDHEPEGVNKLRILKINTTVIPGTTCVVRFAATPGVI